jgi:hypothetical protein
MLLAYLTKLQLISKSDARSELPKTVKIKDYVLQGYDNIKVYRWLPIFWRQQVNPEH